LDYDAFVLADGQKTRTFYLESGNEYYIVVEGFIVEEKGSGEKQYFDACHRFDEKGGKPQIAGQPRLRNSLNISVCNNPLNPRHQYRSGVFKSTGQQLTFWIDSHGSFGPLSGSLKVYIYLVVSGVPAAQHADIPPPETPPTIPGAAASGPTVAPVPGAQCKPGDKEVVQILTGSAGIGARDPKFIMSGASGGQAFGLVPYDGGSPEIRWAIPPAGAWIGPRNGNQYPNSPPAGTYAYRYTFFLENPESSYLSGQWGSDNQMVARLNGNVITNAENSPEFTSLRSFLVPDSSLFRAGINELRFEVNNEGSVIYPNKSPTGLYVNASVCQPESREPEAIPTEPEVVTSTCETGAGDVRVWSGKVPATGQQTRPVPLEIGQKYYIIVRGSVNFGKWWKNGKTLVNDACYEYNAKGYNDPLSVFQNNLNIIVCDNRYHIDHVYCSAHFESTGQPIYFWIFDTDHRDNSFSMLVEIFKVAAPPPTPEPEPEIEFNITSVRHSKSVMNGGPAEDLVVFWKGDPKFPVTMIYKSKQGWNCPQGGCVTVSHTFYESENPFVFKGALWCKGYRKSNVFNYEVLLKDATGKETSPAPAGFRCIVEKVKKTEDNPFEDDKNFSDFLALQQDKKEQRSKDQQDRNIADMDAQFAEAGDDFGPRSLDHRIGGIFDDVKDKPDDRHRPDDRTKKPEDEEPPQKGEEPLETVTGIWKFYLRCKDRKTDVTVFDITLNETEGGAFSGGGSGKDYSGIGIEVQLSGTYNNKSQKLEGKIVNTTDATACVRIDTFSVYLKSGDTGYFPAKQIQKCGCDASVRLEKVKTEKQPDKSEFECNSNESCWNKHGSDQYYCDIGKAECIKCPSGEHGYKDGTPGCHKN
jgi:hypothetical protein